jgi:hypothetical protein
MGLPIRTGTLIVAGNVVPCRLAITDPSTLRQILARPGTAFGLYPLHMSSPNPDSVSPRAIYLDQSAYSAMLSSASDWQSTSLGKILLGARESGRAQVWAGPTNVIETIQAEDKDLRKRLAGIMLDLIEGRRMWCGFEFELLDEYFRILEMLVTGAVRHRQFFDYYRETGQRIWLRALALAAATDAKWLVPVIEDLRRTKTMNQLIHARFAIDPDRWVTAMREASEKLVTTEEDPLAALEHMTSDEMRAEIKQLRTEAQRLSNAAIQKLNRSRAEVAAVYGAFEIGALLQNIFKLPYDLELTVDIPLLIKRWDDTPQLRREPLPRYIRETPEEQWEGNPQIAKDVLQKTIRAVARMNLPVLGIGFEVILREMQRNINQRQLPTAGLAFDGDHASAVNRHHIFVTFDEGLANALRAVVNAPRNETGMPTPQSSAAITMDKPCSPTWQAFTPTQPHKPGNKN